MADFTTGKPVIATDARTIETVDTFELAGGVEYDGSELISNGDFDGNADDWTLLDSGSYADGAVTVLYESSDIADIAHDIALVSGDQYLVTFEVSDATNGIFAYFDNCSFESPHYFGDGVRAFLFTSDFTGTDTIHFLTDTNDPDTGWTIDNVSAKAVGEIAPALIVKDVYGRQIATLGGDYQANLVIGAGALANNTGQENIGIGDGAGYNLTTGKRNIAIGVNVPFPDPTAWQQVAIGDWLRGNNSGWHFGGGTPVKPTLSEPTTLAELKAALIALDLCQ